jgi:SAM-dependent methyltransferase
MRKLAKQILTSLPWIRNKFKANRHARVGKAEFWQMKREFQYNFLIAHGLLEHHKLFDLGCGTLRGGIPLIRFLADSGYTGFDIRREVIKEAFSELKEEKLENKNARLLHADELQNLADTERYDVIWAFSVFIHMDDEPLKQALAFASSHLKQTGKLYANVNLGERFNSSWQGFPVVWRSWETWLALASEYGLTVQNLGTLKSLGHITGEELQDMQMMLEFKLNNNN